MYFVDRTPRPIRAKEQGPGSLRPPPLARACILVNKIIINIYTWTHTHIVSCHSQSQPSAIAIRSRLSSCQSNIIANDLMCYRDEH